MRVTALLLVCALLLPVSSALGERQTIYARTLDLAKLGSTTDVDELVLDAAYADIEVVVACGDAVGTIVIERASGSSAIGRSGVSVECQGVATGTSKTGGLAGGTYVVLTSLSGVGAVDVSVTGVRL